MPRGTAKLRLADALVSVAMPAVVHEAELRVIGFPSGSLGTRKTN
jgi:hypothetical protein